MSKLFSTLLFSLVLLSHTISFAEEGDVEHLIVPEAQEENITPIDTDPTEAEDVIQDEEPQVIDEPTDAVQVPQETIQPEDIQQEDIQIDQTDIPITAEAPTEKVTEEQSEEAPVEAEEPSEDEREALRAEEAELRDVGAGEEPAIE